MRINLDDLCRLRYVARAGARHQFAIVERVIGHGNGQRLGHDGAHIARVQLGVGLLGVARIVHRQELDLAATVHSRQRQPNQLDAMVNEIKTKLWI